MKSLFQTWIDSEISNEITLEDSSSFKNKQKPTTSAMFGKAKQTLQFSNLVTISLNYRAMISNQGHR